MNAQETMNRVKEVLSGRLTDVPRDISVPKYSRWEGPEPIPQENFQIEYHGEAANVLRRVGNRDQHLFPLGTAVRIDVDLNQHVAHVFLD